MVKPAHDFGYYSAIFLHFTGMPTDNLPAVLIEAIRLEASGDHASAARALDDALSGDTTGTPYLRFKALLLRADLAVALNDLGEARGILAEAGQISLSPDVRESLSADLRRFDDLDVFLTHRGCAG